MMSDFLICTDLDRTLIPNGSQPESPDARSHFARLVSNPHIFLAYVTGRDQTLVKQAIDEYQLPVPDFVVADVGVSVYLVSPADWQRLTGWDKIISKSWKNKQSFEIAHILSDIESLQLQEPENQKPNKLSCYLPVHLDIAAVTDTIKNRLLNAGIRANMIWSTEQTSETGMLDILPVAANKRKAIEFLMASQGFDYDHTVFAGDSGNDLDVLISPIKSILVANAGAEIKKAVQRLSENPEENVYIACGTAGKNGNYSAGILEGVFHYFPQLNQSEEK